MLMGLTSEISNQKEVENVGNSSGFMAEEIFPLKSLMVLPEEISM